MLTIQPNARTIPAVRAANRNGTAGAVFMRSGLAHLFLFLQDLVLDLDGDVTGIRRGH
jgi:hypothetical protein